MKNVLVLLLLIVPIIGRSQHTFSIVAVDSITGEIGSAGATCGDSIIWPGTPGAYIISDIIPGVGAIHTQALHSSTNQSNARSRMVAGDSPQQIMDWLVANDVSSNPSIRQYGAVDYNGGSPRSAAYTGASCFDYKNHILGSGYAIQGNILLGQEILDSMESQFSRTKGCLSDRLMAAMQGANIVGADTRCFSEGTSSLSAFLRVANPSDQEGNLYLDINVAGTAQGVEPIDELQTRYDKWKGENENDCSAVTNLSITPESPRFSIYPNPTDNIINISITSGQVTRVTITSPLGNVLLKRDFQRIPRNYVLSLKGFQKGIYILSLFDRNGQVGTEKIVLYDQK
jgi:uncharacterized Ntn-hydrolase superfamily protein